MVAFSLDVEVTLTGLVEVSFLSKSSEGFSLDFDLRLLEAKAA